jgi:[protein-PII] uridylyltransferase
MLRQLFARVSETMGAGVDVLSDEARIAAIVGRAHPGLENVDILEHLAAMPDDYLAAYTDEEIVAHTGLADPVPMAGETRLDVDPGTVNRVTIVGRDIPGFASVVSGVLALHNLSVVNARFNTRRDGVAIDTFDTVDALRSDEVETARWNRVSKDLVAALGGDIDLERRLAAKSKTYGDTGPRTGEPRVRFLEDARRTAVEVKTADRIGLLHDLLEALHELDLDLDLARIDTRGAEAVDTFYVRDDHGRPLDDDRKSRVEESLRQVIAQ